MLLFVIRREVSNWKVGEWNAQLADLAILRYALYGDRTFSLGAIIAQRLHTNRSKGVIYGGIYASRLARYLEVPLRLGEDDLLPMKYLDYDSMVEHNFIDSGRIRFRYNLVFSQETREIITLPAPALFDLSRGRYTIMPEDIYAYWGLIRLRRIYNFLLFHATILQISYTFGNNLYYFWD
jgi:hypothetical protein